MDLNAFPSFCISLCRVKLGIMVFAWLVSFVVGEELPEWGYKERGEKTEVSEYCNMA